MPDYREQNQEAKTWRRAAAAVITNPMPGQGVPAIAFHEHDVVRIGDRIIATPAQDVGPGGLVVPFEPDKVIDLLHPDTGEVIGQATHAQVYIALYSVYIAAALGRDQRAAQAGMPPAEQEPVATVP